MADHWLPVYRFLSASIDLRFANGEMSCTTVTVASIAAATSRFQLPLMFVVVAVQA